MTKNYILASIAALALYATPLQAQMALRNTAGTFVHNTAGTHLRVEQGGIDNQGTIRNFNNIYLDLNYVEAGAGNFQQDQTAGWLWFEGAGNQFITGVATPDFYRVRVDNGNRLILLSNISVGTILDLMNNGSVLLGGFNLDNRSGAIVGYDLNHYVISNAMGVLSRDMSPGDVKEYPVGNSAYNPLRLSSTGGVFDKFGLRVQDAALVSGTAGAPEVDDHVGRTWHLSELVAGGNIMDMEVEWDASQELPDFFRTGCGVKHWDGSAWDVPVFAPAIAIGGTRYAQVRTGQTAFSPFAVIDDTPLPIELLEFEASRRSIDKVDIVWTTASETNNRGFWLQRQLDTESEFRNIAWIDGAGTTVDLRNYTHLDNNAHSGISYYRLQQEDFDGTTAYSRVRAVEGIENKGGSLVLFPNPATDIVNIRFDATFAIQQVELSVWTIDGKLVTHNKGVSIEPNAVLTLNNVSDLAAGTYILRIRTADGTLYTRKFEKITP